MNKRIFFDTIEDKGLVDAIMCGEEWNWNLGLYIQRDVALLKKGRDRFTLISYKLQQSAKDFLTEIGELNGNSIFSLRAIIELVSLRDIKKSM